MKELFTSCYMEVQVFHMEGPGPIENKQKRQNFYWSISKGKISVEIKLEKKKKKFKKVDSIHIISKFSRIC